MIKTIDAVVKDLTDETLRKKSTKAMSEFLNGIKEASPTIHIQVLKSLNDISNDIRDDFGNVKSAEDLKMFGIADIPSPTVISTLISSQLSDYNRKNLRKLAMEVRNNVPKARESFHFAYTSITGDN